MKQLKEILLNTQWGGIIDCSKIHPELNGGLGGWPTFKNKELINMINNNKTSINEILYLIQNDDQVKNKFVEIGLENFKNEESQRDDFDQLLTAIYGYTKDEYFQEIDESYFKEIFLEELNEQNIFILDNERFYMI